MYLRDVYVSGNSRWNEKCVVSWCFLCLFVAVISSLEIKTVPLQRKDMVHSNN